MITTASMKAGFTGGLVVDYPNSSKVSFKYYLNLIINVNAFKYCNGSFGLLLLMMTIIMVMTIITIIIEAITGKEILPGADDWRSSTLASSTWRGNWSS